jgi:hypothetical protein
MRLLLVGLWMAVFPLAGASIYNFQWDTSALKATNANYILDVLLIGDGGNEAQLNNFNFGVGGSGPNLQLTLDTNVQYFNQSMISFTPGSTLSFRLTVTNIASVFPDTFSLYLLDANQNLLETTDTLSSAILTFDLNPVAITTYSGTSPVEFAAPSLTRVPDQGGTLPGPPGGGIPGTPEGAIPEPSSLSLTLGALALWCLLSNKQRLS